MLPLSFFQWCENTWLGSGIRASLWMFPVIEATHLVAFAALGGTLLIVNMRLLGLGMRDRPAAEIAAEMRGWFLGSLLVMLVTGSLLFMSEAVKCYYSSPFWIKMEALLAAILFTVVVQWRVTRASEARVGPLWGRLTAVASIVLWATVAWGGRWIGFSG
jgi:Family of unknown function (DUF6644)